MAPKFLHMFYETPYPESEFEEGLKAKMLELDYFLCDSGFGLGERDLIFERRTDTQKKEDEDVARTLQSKS